MANADPYAGLGVEVASDPYSGLGVEVGNEPAATPPLPESSALGALTRGVTHNLFPAVVGAGGALAGTAGGALTAPVTGPVGAIAGNVGGAVAGTALGEKIQRSILPASTVAEMDAQEAADRAAHPIAAGIGSMIGSVPLMLAGGGIPTAVARSGLKRAGVEATKLAVKEASEKLLPRAVGSAATFAGMSGGEAAAEKVKGLPGSEDVSIANELVKGAVGGVAMAGTGKVLEKFVPLAKTYLGGIGIRAPTDALVLATANSLYDTTVSGKPFDPVETLKAGGESVPAFMLMNAAMGRRGKMPKADQAAPTDGKAAGVAPKVFEPSMADQTLPSEHVPMSPDQARQDPVYIAMIHNGATDAQALKFTLDHYQSMFDAQALHGEGIGMEGGIDPADAVKLPESNPPPPAGPAKPISRPGATPVTPTPAASSPATPPPVEAQGGNLASKPLTSEPQKPVAPGTPGGAVITPVDVATKAHEAATSPLNSKPEPTVAQKEVGNYAKGHIKVHGMDITIENPAGSKRRPEWNPLEDHYGYIKGTVGKDKDHVDVFVNRDNPESDKVFVVNQIDPKTGKFDEHKAVMGANSAEEAKAIYERNYQPGWKGGDSIVEMTVDQFKKWVKSSKTNKPATISAEAKASTPSPSAAKAVTPPSNGGDTSLLTLFLQRLRDARQRAMDGGTGIAPKRGKGQSAMGEIVGWHNQGSAYPEGFKGLDIPIIEKYLAGGKLTEKQMDRVTKALEFVKKEHQSEVDNAAASDLRNVRKAQESEIPIEDVQDGSYVRKNGEWYKVIDKDGELTLKDGAEITVGDSAESITASGVIPPDHPAIDVVKDEYKRQEKATVDKPVEKPASRETLPALEVQTEAQVKAEKRAAASKKALEELEAKKLKGGMGNLGTAEFPGMESDLPLSEAKAGQSKPTTQTTQQRGETAQTEKPAPAAHEAVNRRTLPELIFPKDEHGNPATHVIAKIDGKWTYPEAVTDLKAGTQSPWEGTKPTELKALRKGNPIKGEVKVKEGTKDNIKHQAVIDHGDAESLLKSHGLPENQVKRAAYDLRIEVAKETPYEQTGSDTRVVESNSEPKTGAGIKEDSAERWNSSLSSNRRRGLLDFLVKNSDARIRKEWASVTLDDSAGKTEAGKRAIEEAAKAGLGVSFVRGRPKGIFASLVNDHIYINLDSPEGEAGYRRAIQHESAHRDFEKGDGFLRSIANAIDAKRYEFKKYFAKYAADTGIMPSDDLIKEEIAIEIASGRTRQYGIDLLELVGDKEQAVRNVEDYHNTKTSEGAKFRTKETETGAVKDEITGIDTHITGGKLTAEQSRSVADTTDRRANAIKSTIDAGEDRPQVIANRAGIAYYADAASLALDKLLAPIPGGSEGVLYRAKRGLDVVYKVFKTVHGATGKVVRTMVDDSGHIVFTVERGSLRELLQRIQDGNALGFTPTEIVGITGRKEIIVKQPRGKTEGAARGGLDAQRSLSLAYEIPKEKFDNENANAWLVNIGGKTKIITDIHGGNSIVDTSGRSRVNDFLISDVTPGFLKKAGLEKVAAELRDITEANGDRRADNSFRSEGEIDPANPEREPWPSLFRDAPTPLRRDADKLLRKMLGPNYSLEQVDRLVAHGLDRLGQYYNKVLTIAGKGDQNKTFFHEAWHGLRDLLNDSERAKIDKIEASEEKQADAFMEYAANSNGFTGQLKRWFDRIMFRGKQLFGAANGADEMKAMFARLRDGVYAGRESEAKGVGGAEPSYRTAPLEDLRDTVKDTPRAGLSLPGSRANPYDFGKRLSDAKDSMLSMVDGLKAAGQVAREAFIGLPKVTDWRKAIGEWGYQLQRASRTAYQFSKDIRRAIPDARTSEAITNYLDAGGDMAVLARSEREAPDRYKRGYADAQRLTPEQRAFADRVREYYDKQGEIAVREGWIQDVLDNYINRAYEKDTPWKKGVLAEIGAGNIASGKAGFLKKRLYELNIDAEKAGVRTVKDVRQQILAYDWAFAKTMADRAFVKSAMNMTMPDGRPRFEIAGRGEIVGDDRTTGEANIITPHANSYEVDIKRKMDAIKAANPGMSIADARAEAVRRSKDGRPLYIPFDHPAFRKWKFVTNDTDGRPIIMQGDILVHPDAIKEVKAFLGKSAISQVPVLKTAMRVSSTIKQTMLSISGFHFVQIGVHGLEHRVNPFNLKQIDLSDPTSTQSKLVKGGLMVADTHGHQQWTEGLASGSGSLFSHVPVLGDAVQRMNDVLFKEFIPRMKMTMAEHALERNRMVYEKDIAAGRMTEDQLFALTANESNAAFGHLNYEMLGRSKTTQDLLRLTLLAPDFLEARGRFAAQAFTKYGSEQRVALLMGAGVLYAAARILNKTINDEYHLEPENAFSLVINGRSYSLRTVQGDIIHMITEPSKFAFNRLNPVYGRTTIEFLTGRDAFGRKRDPLQQLGDLAKTATPISLRSQPEQRLFESLLNAFGMTNKRYSAVQDVYKMAEKYRKDHSIAATPEVIYDPDNDPLHMLKVALSLDDTSMAVEAYQKILADKTKTPLQVAKYFREYPNRAFTGSKINDMKFRAGLSEEDKKIYNDAIQERRNIAHNFFKAVALATRRE